MTTRDFALALILAFAAGTAHAGGFPPGAGMALAQAATANELSAAGDAVSANCNRLAEPAARGSGLDGARAQYARGAGDTGGTRTESVRGSVDADDPPAASSPDTVGSGRLILPGATSASTPKPHPYRWQSLVPGAIK